MLDRMGDEKHDPPDRASREDEQPARAESRPTPLDRGTDIAVKALLRRR
jgi:hypothetical protein